MSYLNFQEHIHTICKRKISIDKEKIVLAISWMLVLLFFYAAFNKLTDYGKFKVQLEQSPMLMVFAAQIAWLVPVLEIVIGVLLVFPRTLLTGLFAAFGLMIIFSAYILVILKWSAYVPCSCGGILEKMDWSTHLIFNLVFVGLALGALLLKIKAHDRRIG